jgi:hypothetical protein
LLMHWIYYPDYFNATGLIKPDFTHRFLSCIFTYPAILSTGNRLANRLDRDFLGHHLTPRQDHLHTVTGA